MQARTLTAAEGWRWLAEGYALFRRAPSRLGLVVMGYWLCILLLNAIPFIGPILTSLLVPALSVGVMNACRQIEMGLAVEPQTLFSGLKQHRKTLLGMGALYLLASLLALSFSVLADEGVFLSLMMGQQAFDEATLADANIGTAALTVLLALLPVVMAYWFAPMLVSWFGMPMGKAFFFSFIACQRNWRAFLAYSVALFLYGAFVPLTLLVLLSMLLPAATGFVAALVMVPLLMVFGPTVMASFYISYRDVFTVSDDH